jgi:hypothetical protein
MGGRAEIGELILARRESPALGESGAQGRLRKSIVTGARIGRSMRAALYGGAELADGEL